MTNPFPDTHEFPEGTTLVEARDWLREEIRNGGPGERCPCCLQKAKIYTRPITGSQAKALISLHRSYGEDFGHAPSVVESYEAAMVSLLRYWGLIEELREKRPDGGRAGWYRVTDRGRDWIAGKVTVPRYVHLYGGRFLKLDGDPTTIRQALGVKFNLEELMRS